jgi:hypothetical protein
VFTIILGLSTLLLWLETKKLVIGAEKTAERHLRAYVTVEGDAIMGAPTLAAGIKYHPAPSIKAGLKALVHMSIKNTGQTPAKNVNVRSNMKLVNWPIDPKELTDDTDDCTSEDRYSQDNLGIKEGRTFSKMLKRSLTDSDIDSLQRGKKAIVMYGSVTYEDVFGKKWTTHFRWHTGGSFGLRDYNLTADNEGNDME